MSAYMASNYMVSFSDSPLGDKDEPMMFKKVYGLSQRINTATSHNKRASGGENISGHTQPVTVTLEHGVGDGLKELYNWFKTVRDGTLDKKTVHIILYKNVQDDKAENNQLVTWQLNRAFPTAIHAPEWNAEDDSLAVTKIELIAEGLDLIFP